MGTAKWGDWGGGDGEREMGVGETCQGETCEGETCQGEIGQWATVRRKL